MKTSIFLFLIFLASCSSVDSKKPHIVNFYDINSPESGEFEFEKVFVLLVVNKEEKTMKKCDGVFPFEQLNQEIKNEISEKSTNVISHHKKLLYYKINNEDKIVMSVSNDEEVQKVVNFCYKVKKDLQSQGFVVEN